MKNIEDGKTYKNEYGQEISLVQGTNPNGHKILAHRTVQPNGAVTLGWYQDGLPEGFVAVEE